MRRSSQRRAWQLCMVLSRRHRDGGDHAAIVPAVAVALHRQRFGWSGKVEPAEGRRLRCSYSARRGSCPSGPPVAVQKSVPRFLSRDHRSRLGGVGPIGSDKADAASRLASHCDAADGCPGRRMRSLNWFVLCAAAEAALPNPGAWVGSGGEGRGAALAEEARPGVGQLHAGLARNCPPRAHYCLS